MLIELYTNQNSETPANPEAPISNINGTLPDEEPGLALGDLLGSFSSKEEAINWLNQQIQQQHGQVLNSQSAAFDEYTHIEWLKLTVKTASDQEDVYTYYLVGEEGY